MHALKPYPALPRLVSLAPFAPLAVLALLASGCRDAPHYDGVGGPSPDPEVIEVCDDEVLPAARGICEVTAGAGSAVVLRGEVLGADAVYRNGSVLIDGTDIVCVGCDCAGEPGYADATRVDCADAVISPGLINPHDHITFTEHRPLDYGTTRYEHRHDWRGSLSTPPNPHGTGATSAGTRWGELRMVMGGATAIIGSGRADGMMRNLDQPGPDDLALGFLDVEIDTFPLGDSGRSFSPDCGWSYQLGELEVAQFSAYLPHVAEGINFFANEEFRCQSRSTDGGRDYTERNTAHVHNIGLRSDDYYRMARDGTKLIWSARTNISLYGHTAQVALFHRLGGTIALGTDWTYSGSANVLRELACVYEYNRDYLDGHFTNRELWQMATINAAVATGTDALIGSLEAGKLADIAVFARGGRPTYHAVIGAENRDVALVLREGTPLYGEAETLVALGESCDPVEVCGEARAVCAQREFGTSYADLVAEMSDELPYDAFFCGLPDGEPTCVPSRPGEFSGLPTGNDRDGDGVANARDNCPRVFNPVRPIDRGEQPDLDGDGQGDACDPQPLVPDLDDDGLDNERDNCPFDENAEQDDGDEDGRGDLCDICPDLANPGSPCPRPAATIGAVQRGEIAEGTSVTIDDVVVTGVSGSAVAVQDPAAVDTAYAGLFVFIGSAPEASVGDLVTVSGEVVEYFGLTELTGASVTVKGSGAPIPVTELTVAGAAGEEYEGVLVRVTDVASVDDPWDCSVDDSACADSDLWQVNGPGASIVVWDTLYQDDDWAAQAGTVPVTGVMHYRYNRRRLMPRTAADLGQ